jgi:group I intron endonuclease
MKKRGIYKITNLTNRKVIIGQSRNLLHRWYSYKHKLRKNIYHNPYLQNAWNKYGEQNFKFEVIVECPKEKLDKEEIRLIKIYNSTDRQFGYNIEEGGNRHKNCSEETKQKMRKAKLGIYDGNKNPMFNKHHSEESKHQISESKKGYKHTKEWRINHSIALKGNKNLLGHKHSKETKIKMSKSHQDRKPISKETRRKISDSKIKYWANRKRNQSL